MRDLLRSGRPLLGTFLAIPSPYVVELLASCRFDWICVDMQHGFVDDGLLPSILTAADGCGMPALVRTRWNEPSTIMRALDLGAAGVIAPLINSVEEAQEAVRATRFPPDGIRSWGPLRPLVDGQPRPHSNDDAVCIVMVETATAVAEARPMSEVVDGIFVGPSDLSLSAMGRLGGGIQDEIAVVAEACREANIPAGIACGSAEAAAAAVVAGFRLLTLQWDVSMLAQGAAALLADVSAAVQQVSPE